MPVTIEFTGETMNDVLEEIRAVAMPDNIPDKQPGPETKPEMILDAMSLQELLLYTTQRAEAEGYDMEVRRPPAVARKEEARAKLRGDLEASVKLEEAKIAEDPTVEPPKKKAKASKGNGKESAADLKKRCIAALQKLYTDGHKDKVNKILADFGDGAKNFNTIPDEQFGPIHEALEALTP